MFKAIFWDNDGILVNTEPLYYQSAKEILGRYGVLLTREYFTNHHLKLNLSIFDPAREKGFSEEKIEEMRRERNEMYADMIRNHVPIIDGVSEVLGKLHKKYTMGVVTSSRKAHFETILNKTGLGEYFDFYITCDDVAHLKPDPEIYLKALSKVPFMASECLAIEDTERGVAAARAAGLVCFAIPTEISRSNDFSKADRVLGNVRELLKIL